MNRHSLISKQAYAYANKVAVAFKTGPLNYIGAGKPKNMKSPLRDFDFAGDLKNLLQSDLSKLQSIIRKYIDQTIVNALTDAIRFIIPCRRIDKNQLH